MTAPGLFSCVFVAKIPRTFYFKLTEHSRRENLAVGGFEPRNTRTIGYKAFSIIQ